MAKIMKKNGMKTKKAKTAGPKGKRAHILMIMFAAVVVIIGSVKVLSDIKPAPDVKQINAEKIGEWGFSGDKVKKAGSLCGIALSPDNSYIYVASLDANMIHKMKLPEAADREWTPVLSWGKTGDQPGQFNEVSGLAIDTDGNVYAADAANSRVQKFDADGKYKSEINRSFYRPRTVIAAKAGMVYVADTGLSKLHRLDAQGNATANPAGGRGKSAGEFLEVFGLAIDSKGRLFAADSGNARIQVFSSDLLPLAQFKVKAWKTNNGGWPMIAIDSRDRLYAVSQKTNEIAVYDINDKSFKYMGTIKKSVNNEPLFVNPLGIAVDKEDNLYITEMFKNMVVKIKPLF